MKDIAGRIQDGAMAFLRAEYSYLAVFVVIVAGLLAAAAHDLLQPLNAAKLFAALLIEHREEMTDEQGRLVIGMDSAAWAARLRYATAELLGRQIRVRVSVPGSRGEQATDA